MRRYARQKDRNHAEVTSALRKAGWKVYDIEEPLDLLVCKGAVMGLIEIKNPDADNPRLTGMQEMFFIDPPRNAAVVWSAEEAIEAVERFS